MSRRVTLVASGSSISGGRRTTVIISKSGPQGASGGGDVVGPNSSVDGHVVLFDGVTGKLIKSAGAAPVLEGDARLTDSRTPTSHAASHQDGGSDELALDGTQITSGLVPVARLGTGTPTAFTFLDGTGAWTDDVPVFVPVKNTSGSTIAKGSPVYATGTVGATSVVEIAPADADDPSKMPAIGLTNSELSQNTTGYVTVVGTVKGINTNSYTVNQTVYVSTTPGQLTGTKPTGTSELIQNIGRVTRVATNTGEILVLGSGRSNDVPNAIDAGKLTSGTVGYARLPVGTTANTVAAGDDARFSDARTPIAHVHSGADITSGTVGTARLGSGTADNTTFLRGDGSWQVPAGGGSSSASDLTSGTLNNARLDVETRAAVRITARSLFI